MTEICFNFLSNFISKLDIAEAIIKNNQIYVLNISLYQFEMLKEIYINGKMLARLKYLMPVVSIRNNFHSYLHGHIYSSLQDWCDAGCMMVFFRISNGMEKSYPPLYHVVYISWSIRNKSQAFVSKFCMPTVGIIS